MCTPLLIAALNTMTNIWNKLWFPMTDLWIMKMRYIIYTYIMEYFATSGNDKIIQFAAILLEREDMLKEIREDKHRMISYIGRNQNNWMNWMSSYYVVNRRDAYITLVPTAQGGQRRKKIRWEGKRVRKVMGEQRMGFLLVGDMGELYSNISKAKTQQH